MRYTLGQLVDYLQAQGLEVELEGDSELSISGLATIQDATAAQLSFLANPNYRKYLAQTQAAALILHPNESVNYNGNKIICAQPYVAFACLTAQFKTALSSEAGVHAQAAVDATAQVASSACIGPACVVEAGAEIGANVLLQAGVFIGRDAAIGAGTVVHANASICAGVGVGTDCIIHNNAVIGSEGFGFAPTPQGWLKVHQLGSVLIGNNVEIGASTTIDRGALDNTVIADGVKIDNQVQIAHNVQIGENTAIAACVGISGSTVIGRNCTLAGGVGLVGHITVADNVVITGMTMVTKSIKQAGAYSSGTPMMPSDKWKRAAVRFSQLDKIANRLRKLES